MKAKLPILFFWCGLLGVQHSMAQHQPDSLRKMRLRGIEVMDKKKRLTVDSLSPALRMEASFIETPQQIITVNRELIAQQGGLVMKDIARNASGVYFGYNNSVFDASSVVWMRGFAAATYVNGMQQRGPIDDAAIIETAEFIKGPAGFLASTGEPGGNMNITTKTPGKQRIRNIEIAGGSFNLRRAAFDLGSVVRSKGFSFRLNGAYQYQESFMDFISTHKYVLAPVVQYNFSPRTALLAEYNLIRMTAAGGSSVTKIGSDEDIANTSILRNYGADPGLPGSYAQTSSARLLFTHAFNQRWKLVAQSKYSTAPMETWYLLSANRSPVNFHKGDTTRRLPVFNEVKRTEAVAQVYVKGIFNTGNQVKHYLMTGADYNYNREDFLYVNGKNSFYFDRSHPQYGLNRDSVQMLQAGTPSVTENGWWSVFVYDMIHLGDSWRINAGARYTLSTKAGADQQAAVTPRLGLTWLLKENVSLYALYDQSFIPQLGKDFEQKAFQPLRGNSIEAGAKGAWWQNRLTTSVAVYRIVKNNITVKDLAHPGFRRQIGQVTSTGVEVDVTGNITKRLTVSANYAYTHAIVSKDNKKEKEGIPMAFVPQQQVNTWLQYSIPVNASDRLRLSVGQTTVVKPATYTPGTYLPGYTKWDAGVVYDATKWYVRVVADNLTDKKYFSSGDVLVGSVFPDVKTTYYIDGTPLNFKAFVGVRL
ncbi:TonB-dependent siderophore receptor [Chitinophaga nivalis]|uniref:TonB-dependent siderophore receptor n=1 Tax=Chitinophaga nivalis TaxID=2991709 RepID=A0ABT3II28_9BACT|nr:TonB-dependent siderophore receptor [Chitinophaga nivalis]MCW3466698.1 TonB-dependent siderophore receptor [Chitinophaga nivalis]MCW3483611.1 TonB-dependent siderophore receptor [Chitinophaga nivalis]